MNDIEDLLRTELRQAAEFVDVPTEALVRAARQRGASAIRRKRALRVAPLIIGVAAVVAVIALVVPRTTTNVPIATTANEHPANNLAEKLAASLPAGIQEQIVAGSLGNKNVSDGHFGFVMTGPKGKRVMFQVSVLTASSALLDVRVPPTNLPASVRSNPKARLAPMAARAKSGIYVVTVTEQWLPDRSFASGTDLLNKLSAMPKKLPLDKAALQKIADERGWTVVSN